MALNIDLDDYGFYEGTCQDCDIFQPLNDSGLSIAFLICFYGCKNWEYKDPQEL
jgi:hypothetical protein